MNLNDAIKKVTNLDAAIEDALKHEVADVVKRAIADAALSEVYDAYDPRFLSRRDPEHGGGEAHRRGMIGRGITDPDSVEITVRGTELVAADNPDWQQLWGDKSWRPRMRLAEAIATGDPRYHMDRAGPRPFHEIAKRTVISSGAVEDALRRGLKRQGIDATGVTFEIT